MKSLNLLTLIIIIALSNIEAYGELRYDFYPSIYPFDTPVAYYQDSISIKPAGYLIQKSNLYECKAIDISNARIEVCVEKYGDKDIQPFNCWIDKANIVVWGRPMYENGYSRIELYDFYNGHSTEMYFDEYITEPLIVLDIAMKDDIIWIETLIWYNRRLYRGWTNCFCQDIYRKPK